MEAWEGREVDGSYCLKPLPGEQGMVVVNCRDRVASVHYSVYCWGYHRMHNRLVGEVEQTEGGGEMLTWGSGGGRWGTATTW